MADRVIAIDGPAGSGKTSTAREVARRMGFVHLDSGALYRAVTLAALDAGVPLDGTRAVALAESLPIRWVFDGREFRPEIAGVDVSEAVREARVNAGVSAFAALSPVRDWVNEQLRRAARAGPAGVVVDGRDIGTVVFPDAGLKVFLTADPDVRAARRLRQEGRAVDAAGVSRQSAELVQRDEADSARAVAPLRPAPEAVVLDTTVLGFEEQVAAVVRLARQAFA